MNGRRRSSSQGRFSGRGSGRGRDGGQRGRSNSRNSGNKNENRNNVEMKFVPHYSGKQLSHTYDTVKDHIVLQVQKNFRYGEDMAKALQDMQYEVDPGD